MGKVKHTVAQAVVAQAVVTQAVATLAVVALALAAAPAWAQSAGTGAGAPPPASAAHDHPPPAEEGFKRTPAPADAYVYIGWPNDNETVRTTHIKVWFGTRNFGVAPAGTYKANTGHHHLLIDTKLPPLDQPIPNDKNHLHFGLGQTEARLDLPPGRHTIQLLLGDENHVPHQPPLYSRRITVTVLPAGTP
jgi:hypothetical protein